ncbi:MAG TPA: Sir2 family NAD-dependent protein deacetylase [Vicinamibacterales bacterium]|jgi:NAD-dependent deacetylase
MESRRSSITAHQAIGVERAIRDASRLLVITGAGVSAESGIPTFRDPGGWWKQRNPEEMATRKAFDDDPAEIWGWYDMRRGMIARAQPNRAHRALARAEVLGRTVSIVTQNVDDLHERAGSREVVHVHGSIWELRCIADGHVFEDRRVPLPMLPPRCEDGHLARPNVTWWDEDPDAEVITRVDALLDAPYDVVLVVGTEATFDYIQNWARRAKRLGALLVEINPRETTLTPEADARIAAPAGEALDGIVARIA